MGFKLIVNVLTTENKKISLSSTLFSAYACDSKLTFFALLNRYYLLHHIYLINYLKCIGVMATTKKKITHLTIAYDIFYQNQIRQFYRNNL